MRDAAIYVCLTILLCAVTPCSAWNGEEHTLIGTAGYHRACERIREIHGKTTDEAVVQRVDLACSVVGGGVAYGYEQLMGEWSALAADHTDKPEQLTSLQLGDLVVDYRVMTRIAITNYRHFHPASVTSWRAEHLASLDAVSTAAAGKGTTVVERFEAAAAIQAFAQHYLQDSFAAGHMGFNRVASSNAAALAYHNRANKAGRCVANQHNEAWFTYGDGELWRGGSGAARVIDATAHSFFDFLNTFVAGSANSTEWQHIWAKLPASFNEDATTSSLCTAGQNWPALRSVSRPAQPVLTFELFTLTDASIYRPAPRALMFGASREIGMPIPIGYRVIHTRLAGAVGATIDQIGNRAYLLDMGYVWQVGTSARGTLTHEFGYGQLLYYMPQGSGYDVYFRSSLRLFYAAKIEAGRIYIRGQTGAAWDYYEWGPNVSVGVGWVTRSSK